MPFNGSGTFSIVNFFVPNTTILSAAVNQNFTDIATGLSDCLTRDGQAGMTAALKAISGSLSAPSITFNSDATSGLYLSTSGAPGFVSHALGMILNTNVFSAVSATVQAGGSGYAIGDTITPTGGTAVIQPHFTVATLTGTAVATVTVSYPGFLTATASNPASQGSTSGSGTGCTLNVTYNTPVSSDYRALFTDQAGALLWQKFGASSFVSGLMDAANGKDFVTAIGASNVSAALGLSAPPPSSFKNLIIKVTTNTALTAAADFVVMTNGTAYQTLALSSTINMATTGANALDTGSIATSTWYAIWAIAQPNGTVAGLASTSFTSPTMPTGYTYKARIGAVRTASATAQLLGTWQFGYRAQYVLSLAQTGTTYPGMANLTGGYWTPVSISNFVPPSASQIFGQMKIVGAANLTSTWGASPNSSPSTPQDALFYRTQLNTNAFNDALHFDMLLESSNIFYGEGNITSGVMTCAGWYDQL